MHLHITTLLFIVLEHINNIFTQGIPVSPCPKLFQYRFDGTEWFGILSVRNPDIGQPLHLRVTLSMRGKPTTNYLGEIELLTRGQFLSDAPVLYKIRFPKTHFPPKLLQITTNNQIVCFGAADHGIFVTQIQLEHTRKLTFIPDDMAMSLTPDFSLPASTSGVSANGAPSTDVKDSSELFPANVGFSTKHLPLGSLDKSSMQANKDICGKIDDRIRFQVFHVMQMIMSPPAGKTELDGVNVDVDAAGALLPRKDNRRIGANIPLPLPLPLPLLRTSDLNVKLKLDVDADSIVSPTFADVDDYDDDYDNDDDDDVSNRNRNGPTGIDELPSITRGAWPWLAAIYVNNLTTLAYQCSGTLVSARVVISSAHCFQMFKVRYTANEVLVFLGRHNLKNWNEEGSLAAPVDDIFVHPDYDAHLNSYDADIAVVVLKHTVRFNTFIRPACMWSGSTKTEYIEGEPGVVVGWGLSSSNQSNGSNKGTLSRTTSAVPRIISAPIVSNDVCFKANENFRSLSSNRTFCAGIVLSSGQSVSAEKDPSASVSKSTPTRTTKTNGRKLLMTGPCTGDSGAGLMIYKNNRWILRGTVSATLPSNAKQNAESASAASPPNPSNCNVNQYVIYTDVAKFLDWVFAFII